MSDSDVNRWTINGTSWILEPGLDGGTGNAPDWEPVKRCADSFRIVLVPGDSFTAVRYVQLKGLCRDCSGSGQLLRPTEHLIDCPQCEGAGTVPGDLYRREVVVRTLKACQHCERGRDTEAMKDHEVWCPYCGGDYLTWETT